MPDPFPYPRPDEASPRDVDDLLQLLELEELDRDLYRADNPSQPQRWRLFGGQVAAQAVRAASLTVPEGRVIHSLHGYFLRPGDPDRHTVLHVDRDRDGRSYSARHVVARQHGDAIFTMLASFQVDEEEDLHQEVPAPAVPDPDDIPTGDVFGFGSMFDIRSVPLDGQGARPGRPTSTFWARTRSPLPDDPMVHLCVLTFLSDLGSGFFKRQVEGSLKGGPSLDHAVWFHRPVRMDDWVLVDLNPVELSGGRGYYTGGVYDGGGNLVASIAQEHIWRPMTMPPFLTPESGA